MIEGRQKIDVTQANFLGEVFFDVLLKLKQNF